jgi:hypothetical protein
MRLKGATHYHKEDTEVSKYYNPQVARVTRTATRVGLGITGEGAKVATGLAVGIGQATKPVLDGAVKLAKPWWQRGVNWISSQVQKAEEAERSREIERQANGETR